MLKKTPAHVAAAGVIGLVGSYGGLHHRFDVTQLVVFAKDKSAIEILTCMSYGLGEIRSKPLHFDQTEFGK